MKKYPTSFCKCVVYLFVILMCIPFSGTHLPRREIPGAGPAPKKNTCFPDMRDELSHYVSCPHVWNVARTAFPYLRFQALHDRLCVDKPCTESLKVLAATLTAYHIIKPSLGKALLSFVTARCQFQCSFDTAVHAAGLSPDTPAD